MRNRRNPRAIAALSIRETGGRRVREEMARMARMRDRRNSRVTAALSIREIGGKRVREEMARMGADEI